MSMSPGLELVDLRELRDEALLERVHRELYVRAFVEPSETENVELWRELLWGRGAAPDWPCELHCLVGWPANEGRGWPAAALWFEYHRVSRCGLLTYLVVDAEWRRRGFARLLVEAALQRLELSAKADGQTLRGVFTEVHDPRGQTLGDTMEPLARVRTLQRLGARALDVPYVQPELAPGQGRARGLILMAFVRHSGDGPPNGAVVRDFLSAFYRLLGVADPEADDDCRRMLASLERDPVATLTF